MQWDTLILYGTAHYDRWQALGMTEMVSDYTLDQLRDLCFCYVRNGSFPPEEMYQAIRARADVLLPQPTREDRIIFGR